MNKRQGAIDCELLQRSLSVKTTLLNFIHAFSREIFLKYRRLSKCRFMYQNDFVAEMEQVAFLPDKLLRKFTRNCLNM